MAVSWLATCAVGLGLGLRHSLESDHLAAIGTLLARGHGARRAALLGAAWGCGHALAVLGAGLVLLALGVRVPLGIAAALDIAVAVMLVGLGARALLRRGDLAPSHAHEAPARSPLGAALIGLVHGASGTAAVTLLVLTTIPSRAAGAAFLGLFAAGATFSMTVLSALLALPLRAALDRWRTAPRTINVVAGALSLAAALAIVVGIVREAERR
jgi:nickel/cobalt exporter